MNRFFIYSLLTVLAASCTNEKQFTLEGNISDAAGKTVYLEKAGVARTSVIDSVQLKGKGEFRFRTAASSSPEYYRLRLDNQAINISADSTETVRISGAAADFSTGYKVEGSMECEKIRTVTVEGMQLRKSLIALNDRFVAKEIGADEFNKSVLTLVGDYKQKVQPYIFENPRAAVAYFTLFQRVNGLMIFDPYDKSDYRAFGAVATGWDTYYNGTERASQLVGITLEALSYRRKAEGIAPQPKTESMPVVEEQNQIEIVLPNIYGANQKLSEMKGKVVLLDFTAYASDYSGPYNIALASVYEKYKSKGFEIFQVSLDNDENFWKTTASNLPWLTVRDKDSVYSRFARSYNVTTLPTAYLLGRDGSIISRSGDIKDLEASIRRLL